MSTSTDTREALAAECKRLAEDFGHKFAVASSLAAALPQYEKQRVEAFEAEAALHASIDALAALDAVATHEQSVRALESLKTAPELLAALTEQPAAPTDRVRQLLRSLRAETENLHRLLEEVGAAALAEAPQGDSLARCGEPSGAVSGGSGIDAVDLDITLSEEASGQLRTLLGIDNEPCPLRIQVGDGHSGRGLYVSMAEYPEEGATLLHAAPQGVPAEPVAWIDPVDLAETLPGDGWCTVQASRCDPCATHAASVPLYTSPAPAAPAQEPQQPARATRMPPASSTASDEWEA